MAVMSEPIGKNTSFDGSPVRIQLESPVVVFMDPLGLDWVRDQLASLPADARRDIGAVLSLVNADGV
jgi:hypothetical protein